ncbi:MAG: AI-2E family transporter [Saprospiraceae bacterium]|nr:MAG: AI-2E family transporter [Saprospiraceae bacterium]
MQRNAIIRTGFFLLIAFLATIAFIGLIKDFLMPCFWAIVLALIFRTTYRRLRIQLKGRSNLASFLTTLIILLVVVVPIGLISISVGQESAQLYQQFKEGEIAPEQAVNFVEKQLPKLESFLRSYGIEASEIEIQVKKTVVDITQFFANRVVSFTQDTINLAIQFFLMLYLLFFFLRDGERIMYLVVNSLPMGNKREWMIFQQFAVVSRATLKGTVIVAAIQGTLGGILFWLVGIEAPVLWGVLMTFLSLLPVGGSGLVWGPAAIIMLIQGEIAKGVIILVVGGLLIGLVDNLLRPLLVSRETSMPDYLILLTTLGGLTWFGLSGFIIGPVIAALFITCWKIMGQEYGGKDS